MIPAADFYNITSLDIMSKIAVWYNEIVPQGGDFQFIPQNENDEKLLALIKKNQIKE